jgi:hypothetical protein
VAEELTVALLGHPFGPANTTDQRLAGAGRLLNCTGKDGETTYFTNIVIKQIDVAQSKDPEDAGDED